MSSEIAGVQRTEVDATLLTSWLRREVGTLLEVAPEEVDLDRAFDRCGLDSVAVVGLSGKLTDLLGREVDPVLFYENNTIRQLSAVLAALRAVPS